MSKEKLKAVADIINTIDDLDTLMDIKDIAAYRWLNLRCQRQLELEKSLLETMMVGDVIAAGTQPEFNKTVLAVDGKFVKVKNEDGGHIGHFNLNCVNKVRRGDQLVWKRSQI